MDLQHLKVNYLLQLADTNLILSHRLAEWCGVAPELEIDMAWANIGLDLLGEARNCYQYAAELEGQGKTEDDYAYLREEREYKNLLIAERPNEGFDVSVVRQFLYDHFHILQLQSLQQSSDEQLAAIAKKSLKEVSYHLRYTSGWIERLGDGTELSNQKIQAALDSLWSFTEEMFIPGAEEQALAEAGVIADMSQLKAQWLENVQADLSKSNLTLPELRYAHTGGKEGKHSEYLGFVLAELQYMQRTYPNQQW
ncbi:1,2-phenylacetyl-CoA epoxidase subunit PaaC [Vibrio sp. SCSIO 43137]|uniref:1,2-phenylacetyl-CoA epoxidase subunit PaaC n=1 Tax=Vibrio sp. SCSIO 43137 TaxID=3021011 RepID=UPI002307AE2A|nr:1,2-phenylacetyl-CoA epoxidase subunit PaaC [Vibrio sp. SCSIO 43137]WCE30902.1 phenylacetate-CoA oxygenase subunit PaaC [Vibrio sp. SCSIO 43137]